MEIDIEVEGLQELEKRLLKLGATVGVKALESALMSSSLEASKSAIANAPGSIKDAIKRIKHRGGKKRKIKVRGISSQGKETAGVSIIVDRKKAPHAHLLEFGTKPRYTIGRGSTRRSRLASGRVLRRKGRGNYRNAHRGRGPKFLFMTNAWKRYGGEKSIEVFKKRLLSKIKQLERAK